MDEFDKPPDTEEELRGREKNAMIMAAVTSAVLGWANGHLFNKYIFDLSFMAYLIAGGLWLPGSYYYWLRIFGVKKASGKTEEAGQTPDEFPWNGEETREQLRDPRIRTLNFSIILGFALVSAAVLVIHGRSIWDYVWAIAFVSLALYVFYYKKHPDKAKPLEQSQDAPTSEQDRGSALPQAPRSAAGMRMSKTGRKDE